MATLFSISHFLLLSTLFKYIQYSASSLPGGKHWYEAIDPENQPKAHFDYLHKSGCCSDRVECRAENGDRIFKSVDASASFPDPRVDAPKMPVFALLFGEVISVHEQISDENLESVFSGLISSRYMQDSKETERLLGYSPLAERKPMGKVRAWMHYKKKHIFVCSAKRGVIIRSILNIKIPNDYVYLTKKEACLQEREEESRTNPEFETDPNIKGHPAMCEENLVDLLAIPEGNGKITVVAYIDKLEGMDVHGKRTIEVKVWEDEVEQNQTDKYESQLASIYWYRLDDNIAHGIYFTTDAFACKFEYELGKGDFAIDRFKFDKKNQEKELCRPMAVYLQCPQGWCYQLGMTTSFTIEHKGFYYVYFTKGLWHWRVKTRKIPMSVPRIEDTLYYGSAKQNIWKRGQNYKGVEKPEEAPYPPIMIFDATAAFRIKHYDKNYTFSYEPLNGWNSVPDKAAKKNSFGELATNWKKYEYSQKLIPLVLFEGIRPEAAYFDENERKLYLFQDSQYTVFQVNDEITNISSDKAWNHIKGPESVSTLNFEKGVNIKEIIALGDNLNFIINDTHFYHSVGNITESTKELKFSFSELFRVQSECYYNDYREFKKILDIYDITLPEQTVTQRKYDVKQMQKIETESNWGTLVIFLIIAFGVAVALVGLLAMFLYGRTHNRTETKVIKKYSTESSGVKERKLTKEPLVKLKSIKKL